MPNPQTPDEWWQLVAQQEEAAQLLIGNKNVANQGYFHIGLAVEAALKAYICKRERFNRWPDRKADPALYTHNLLKLFNRAGIIINESSPYAPNWHILLRWQRGQGYDHNKMPRKVAKAFFEAAFGEYGVVTWLRQN